MKKAAVARPFVGRTRTFLGISAGDTELQDGAAERGEGVVPAADGESSLSWQAAQLAAARPLLAQAPEDEVVGELYAAQAGLLAQLASNATRSARLLQHLLPSLPAQLRAARVRGERACLVNVYLAAEKEAKKHDRKLKKDKEAQAVLAAATAAAAASPRNTHLRKEGSFAGTPGSSPRASERAATPPTAPSSGPVASQQIDLARAAAAGAAGVSSAKPPKAPGSGSRSGSQAKVLARNKGESRGDGQLGRAATRAPGVGPGAGAPAGERSGRGRSVRPSLPDEWPRAESGEALCAVCGQGEAVAPNEVVFCEQCGVAVHQECYGVRVIPTGPWWCQPCAYNRQRLSPSAPPLPAAPGEPPGRGHPGVRCALCPGRTGALKRAMAAGPDAAPQWVHVFCAQWMPGTNPGKGEGALVEGLETLGPDRANARCSLCGSKLGACLTCSAGRCSHKFHASCARNGGLAMSLQSTPDGRLLYHQYCELHSAHPPATPAKEATASPPDKEQELVKLKIIRVEFERVRMICDRVVRREKLKRERVRTLRELGAVQLALVSQAGAVAGEAEPGDSTEPRAKRHKKSKDRDEPGGGPANGLALGEQDHASVPEPDETVLGQHVGGPRTNLHQKKRQAAGEMGGDHKRQRASTLARERMMTSMEASQNNCKLPAGFSYVPIADLAPDGRPLQSWGRREEQNNRVGTSRHNLDFAQ